jgi:hypothetical protein
MTSRLDSAEAFLALNNIHRCADYIVPLHNGNNYRNISGMRKAGAIMVKIAPQAQE